MISTGSIDGLAEDPSRSRRARAVNSSRPSGRRSAEPPCARSRSRSSLIDRVAFQSESATNVGRTDSAIPTLDCRLWIAGSGLQTLHALRMLFERFKYTRIHVHEGLSGCKTHR